MALTQVKTLGIEDDAVTLAKQAAGTDGQIITYDASGNPTAVGPGNDGQVLTSTGAGSPPAFEDVPAGGATINNATENELVTVASTTSQLDAETNLVFDGTRLIVGSTASSSETWQPKVQIVGTESLGLGRASADNAGGHIHFYKSRNATWGSNTIVQDNDQLGNIIWYADDGTDYKSPAASIQGAVDGTPGSNDMPGRIVFNTTPDGSETLTERLRISSDGKFGFNTTDTSGNQRVTITQTSHDTPLFINTDQSNCYMGLGNSAANNGYIGFESTTLTFHSNGKKAEIDTSGNLKILDGDLIIGTSGHGIDFSATSNVANASEVLDDYETGNWTIDGDTANFNGFSSVSCYYTKVGRVVNVTGKMVCATNSSSTNFYIKDFPYAAATNALIPVSIGVSQADDGLFFNLGPGLATGYLRNASQGLLNYGQCSNQWIYFTGSYVTNA